MEVDILWFDVEVEDIVAVEELEAPPHLTQHAPQLDVGEQLPSVIRLDQKGEGWRCAAGTILKLIDSHCTGSLKRRK